ncbi:ABC transporter permease [Chitinophaga filiformis]|uniref:ABC transporter permease n=1 Tax=Chitinophaga filiformis TaxID=104663 RepID=UPI001F36C9E8|nr:ABC transporter permease [Chitinophaga filiformis]MCF6404396.1 ABC transporter permease [Chitinophaga filiformis]
MIKHYFTLAFRNLFRNKVFTVINIGGLAIGLCCFLLIVMYVLNELSYDHQNVNADRIYRIHLNAKMGGMESEKPLTPDPMGELLKKDYPQVEEFTRIFDNSTMPGLVRKGNEFVREAHTAYVDSSFFKVFSFPAVQGDVQTALNEPNSVVISASTALKYFGTTQALGKTLEVQDNGLYKVNAVIKDMPENMHFHYDMLFSMKNLNYKWGDIGNHNFYTYLLLKKGADYKHLEAQLPDYVSRYLLPHIMERMHLKTKDEFEKAGNHAVYTLMPLTKIHLYSHLPKELGTPGSIQYVYVFSAVALFILLIACINFMNLTTARSAGRAREVGVRKALGTARKELVLQFLTESVLLVFLSLLLAIAMVFLALPLFNQIAGKTLQPDQFLSIRAVLVLMILPLIVGVLAGSYPAFFLSAFKPVQVLKGRLVPGKGDISLRSILVVFQFATSIILIIGTLVVYRQLDFIRKKNLGYNKDQVLIIENTSALGTKEQAFKNEVTQLTGIRSGTISPFLPVGNTARSSNNISKQEVVDANSSFNAQAWAVDENYVPTIGLQLLKGRNFSKNFTDDRSVIINEATAKMLGYDDPVGKQCYLWTGPGQTTAFTIIGLVKDFNYESLRQDIGPLCLFNGPGSGLISFKVNTADINTVLAQVKEKWRATAPDMPFTYSFMDQSFDAMYRSEQQVGQIAMAFSILAIIIACMGIFGLATFIAEQRTKEIGIRKVLGASTSGIVQLLSKDFMKLVAIAFVTGAPLAGWIMHRWLQDFAFRVELSWWIFAAAGAGALLIALLTISVQSVRAALANPLKSLSID